MGFYLTILLLLGAAVTTVVGRRLGAPPEACTSITPNHTGSIPQTSTVPYTVNISSLDDGYTPGQNYTIILSGGDNNADFRGFLIQGRLMADDTAIGTFLDNGEDQQLACDGNTSATHVNATEKTMVQLMWNAPPMGTGAILFRYAFVDMFTTFWANQTTGIVYEVTNGTENITISPTSSTSMSAMSSTANITSTSSVSPTQTGTGDGGAAGVMAASSVLIMLLASIITLIN